MAVPLAGVRGPRGRGDPRTRSPEADAYAIRLGLGLVKGIGEEVAERLDAELDRGPYRSLEDVVARTGLSEEVIERLIRAGALDSLGTAAPGAAVAAARGGRIGASGHRRPRGT